MFSLAILVSVGVNAIVSPILGALSDRGGRRLPLLLLFTLLCVGPTSLIALGGPLGGLILFTIANFAYMSALIYYDASLKLVSTPGDARPDVGDRRRASGTAARCLSG